MALVPPPGGSPGGGVGEEAGGWRGEVVGGGRQGVGVAADRGGGENVDGIFLWKAGPGLVEKTLFVSSPDELDSADGKAFSPQHRGLHALVGLP